MVSKALEYSPGDPHHALVLADLDPELHGLPLGIPAGVLGGKVKNMATAILAWLLPGRAGKRSSPFWRNTPISEISLADHHGVNG